jgi:hypothetical protein
MDHNETHRWMILVLVVAALFAALACGGTAATAPPPQEEEVLPTPEPTAEVPVEEPPAEVAEPSEAPGEAAVPLEAVERAIRDAVLNRDREAMIGLMGDPFVIAWWQSEGSEWTPAEAADELINGWLLPGNPLTFFEPEADYLTGLLGGMDPLTMWGPDVDAVSALYSTGWGSNGYSEALLIVAARPEGGFYWHATLVAPEGFGGVPQGDNATMREDFEIEVMRAIVERDYDIMPRLMGEQFEISGWQAGGAAWSPEEAVERLRTEFYPPEGDIVIFDTQADIAALLGQNPADFFGGGVSFLYSVGWGPEGNGEAIVVIDATDDGVLYWRGILVALYGF